MTYIKTNNKKYVIRGYQFGYNDECFYIEGNRIESIFTDKVLAEKSYRALEIKAARAWDLSEVENLFDGDDKIREACHQFLMEKYNMPLLTDDGFIEWGTHLPREMSDTDVLEFIKLADMHSYQLLAFDNEKKFYALWLPKENNYYLEATEGMEYLVYEESEADLLKIIKEIIDYNGWNPTVLKGTLAEISHSPNILEYLIKKENKISYLSDEKMLKVSGSRPAPYIALNELLREPLFEIHQLSLEEVVKIEKKLEGDYLKEW